MSERLFFGAVLVLLVAAVVSVFVLPPLFFVYALGFMGALTVYQIRENRRRRRLGLPSLQEEYRSSRASIKSYEKEMELQWCPNCEQRVRPVRRAKALKLIATGAVGYALTKPTMCPICKGENLTHSRPVATEPA